MKPKTKKSTKKAVVKKPQSALLDKPKKVTVSRLEIGATIPTRQYENIQPKIEMKDIELSEGTKIGMNYIESLTAKYGQHGAFEAKEVGPVNVEVSATVKMKSFNEDVEIDFDPINHKYYFEGKELIGGSKLTSTFFKPFDAEKIAEVCAKAWGVPAEAIRALWSSNGDIANQLGTVIHKALEHSEVHYENGLTISAKKSDGSNPAELKHPILNKIVSDFYEMYEKTQIEGEVLTEVLVTDVKGGYCGQIDRLVVTGKKKCRVDDIKVNVDAEVKSTNSRALKPFEALPANKLTKYQIQMSIYGNILQNSGWEVEGLDAFVLEEEWKHFELPVLKVLK